MKIITFVFLSLFAKFAFATVTISGQVTDKSNRPVEKCDVFFNANAWIDDSSIHARCDSNGNYSVEIEPGKYNSIYVCDEEQYGKTKLEFWGWNLNLEHSQRIDAQFDTMEVFSLATWASNGGSNSIFASFRPMSLKKAQQPDFREMQHNGKKVIVFDISPVIDESSIRGFVDDKALTLLEYNWGYEKVASCNGLPKEMSADNGCYMPMIIAQFKKPKLLAGQHTLKIDLVDADNGDFGQGITHFTSNAKGLGF